MGTPWGNRSLVIKVADDGARIRAPSSIPPLASICAKRRSGNNSAAQELTTNGTQSCS
jgi:hypothetical protein